jgi:hypothetical protein
MARCYMPAPCVISVDSRGALIASNKSESSPFAFLFSFIVYLLIRAPRSRSLRMGEVLRDTAAHNNHNTFRAMESFEHPRMAVDIGGVRGALPYPIVHHRLMPESARTALRTTAHPARGSIPPRRRGRAHSASWRPLRESRGIVLIVLQKV